MKAVIIGYGVMGHEVEKILSERGHELLMTIDAGEEAKFGTERFRQADVAIEFSTPATAFGNVAACLRAGVPVVSGTTGWNDRIPEAEQMCRELNGAFFHASNFSIGVNILFRVNACLAELMERFPDYDVSMREVHHTRKKDAPSGTAITLAEGILSRLSRKHGWVNEAVNGGDRLGIESVREGDVAGIHEIRYESEADRITLRHEAKGRRGFALGAVLAAEFTRTHHGVLGMDDLFGLQ